MKITIGVMLAMCAVEASAQSYVSPEFLAPAPGGGAYVTEATAARVAEVGRDGRVVRQWLVSANPTGIAAGGGFVYVTSGMADGEDIVVRNCRAGQGEGSASGGVVHRCGAGEVSVVHRVRGAGLDVVA